MAAFTAIGLGLAIVLGATGLNRFAANPWLNLAIAVLFAGFAFSLFGILNLGVPGSFANRIDDVTAWWNIGERHLPNRVAGALRNGDVAIQAAKSHAHQGNPQPFDGDRDDDAARTRRGGRRGRLLPVPGGRIRANTENDSKQT